MGKDFSSVDAAFGFQPYGNILRAQLYAVPTAPTVYIFHNDIVVHGGSSVSTPIGYLPIIEDGSVPDSDPFILGSVLEVFDEDMVPVKYITIGEVGNGTIAGYVLVADDPNQLFIAQEDGETNAIDLAEAGNNCDLIAGTLCAGNTNTGIGKMELDSDSAKADATAQFKLIRPHEDDTPADDTNHYARWIVQVNEHFYHDVVGIGI
jgi:hypothetical protein